MVLHLGDEDNDVIYTPGSVTYSGSQFTDGRSTPRSREDDGIVVAGVDCPPDDVPGVFPELRCALRAPGGAGMCIGVERKNLQGDVVCERLWGEFPIYEGIAN